MYLKLTDIDLLHEFKLSIDSYEIEHQDVRDLEIHWNVNEIYIVGEVKFVDTIHMIEHKPIKVNDKVTIYWVDAMKENYKQEFIITDVKEERADKNEVLGIIRFIDQNAFEFMRSFRSKGFSHAKTLDIAKFLINEYKKDDKSLKSEASGEHDWGNEQNGDTKSHVLPGDRTVMNNLYRLMKEGNFLIFQDRKNIKVTEWKKMTGGEKVDYKLTFVPGNQTYIGKMGDYHAHTADAISANLVLPAQETIRIKHPDGKKIIKKDIDYKKAIDESGKTGGTDIKWVEDNGTKNIGYSTNTSQSFMYGYKKYVNNMILMECVVTGYTKRDVGKTIEVQMETLDVSPDIDKNMSGKWVIVKIVDKVQQGFFTQKLTLARSVQK